MSNEQKNRGNNRRSSNKGLAVPEEELKKILSGDRRSLVTQARKIGKRTSRGLQLAHLRPVLSGMKRIEVAGGNLGDLHMLRPKLAYAAAVYGRHSNDELHEIAEIFSGALELIGDDMTKLHNLSAFVEATFSYHRFFGGR